MTDETESLIGRKNIYVCQKCFNHVVTVDRDKGVTPFMIGCRAPGCGGMMQSSMYRVFDQSMRAAFEWYRPPVVQQLTPAERAHVDQGGLLMRPIVSPSVSGGEQ